MSLSEVLFLGLRLGRFRARKLAEVGKDVAVNFNRSWPRKSRGRMNDRQ